MTFKFKDPGERALLEALENERDESIEALKYEKDLDKRTSLEGSVARSTLLINAIKNDPMNE